MSCDSLLYDLVNAWLRGDDDVIEWSGEPSWESLHAALRRHGHNGIASDIQKKGQFRHTILRDILIALSSLQK